MGFRGAVTGSGCYGSLLDAVSRLHEIVGGCPAQRHVLTPGTMGVNIVTGYT